MSAVEGLHEGFDFPFALPEGRFLRFDGGLFLLNLVHRRLGVRHRSFVLPQILEFNARFLELAFEFLQGFLRLAFRGRARGLEFLHPRLQSMDRVVVAGDLRGLRVGQLAGVLEILTQLGLAGLRLFPLRGVDLQQDGRVQLFLVGLEGLPGFLAQSHRSSQQLELFEELLVKCKLLRLRELPDLVFRQIAQELVDVFHDDLQFAFQVEQFLLLLHQLVALLHQALHLLLELDHPALEGAELLIRFDRDRCRLIFRCGAGRAGLLF